MLFKSAAVLAATTGLILCSAAPGLAATPKSGTFNQFRDDGNYKISLNVNQAKTKVTPHYYNDCATVPVVVRIRIKDDGSFKFDGTREDVLGDEVHVFIKGKFVKPKVAKGTVQFTSDGCEAAVENFRAVWNLQP